MSKSMIGLDPLAWLNPGKAASAGKKKTSKTASNISAASKKGATKKVSAKPVSQKKPVNKKTVTTKASPSKKSISKATTSKTTNKKVMPKKVSTKAKAVNNPTVVHNKTASTKVTKPVVAYVSPLGLDVETLESSFNLLAPRAEELVSNFYTELFKQHPSVIPMFKNTNKEEQQKKLLAALKLVINNIRKPEVLGDALKGLGSKHQGYGAVPEYYKAVANTLIGVMKDMAADAWTHQIQTAWEKALNTIAEVMLGGYEISDTPVEVTEPIKNQSTLKESSVGNSTIKLKAVQDISSVAELYKLVSEKMNQSDIVFDGADVERIDASSLQLLTCVFKQAKKYGATASWHGCSDALKNSVNLLGLTEALSL